jgi:DHA1 family bicyclomycin/chloramphenicol resistance-like MFS transporter
VTFGIVAWRFRETNLARNARALQLAPLVAGWRSVAANRTFRAWAALLSCTYGGLFLFLTGSAIVLIEQRGASRLLYGAMLASVAAAYLTGTLWCRRLLSRYGMAGTVHRAVWFSLTGGLSMLALELAGVRSLWAILLPQWIYMIGHGVHQPCGQAGAVGPFPEKAGTAAALSGFLVMAVAFAAGMTLGRVLHSASWPLTSGIALFSVAVAAFGWTTVRRYGDTPHGRAARR